MGNLGEILDVAAECRDEVQLFGLNIYRFYEPHSSAAAFLPQDGCPASGCGHRLFRAVSDGDPLGS